MSTARTVLLVDDDDELRASLKDQLALHDEFDILTAGTAGQGIEIARETRLDLVLLDVGLPDMDGREACKVMRKAGFKSPIIMLTGNAADSDIILGLDAGANDYVTKPFKFAVLLARVRPNEDISLAIEEICSKHGIEAAEIYGIGSLNEVWFADGRRVASLATEILIQEGRLERISGRPKARLNIAAVDIEGGVYEGDLAHGDNPVCVTFELVIRAVESKARPEK